MVSTMYDFTIFFFFLPWDTVLFQLCTEWNKENTIINNNYNNKKVPLGYFQDLPYNIKASDHLFKV